MKTRTRYIRSFLHLWLTVGLAAAAPAQTIWITRTASVSFYSDAPIEDIKARSTKAEMALDPASRSVYCKIPIRSFSFRKKLMQEHFNEKYLESDRYPYAEFSGRIMETVDLLKAGNYEVTVQGRLTIHNVPKDYTIRAMLNTTGGIIRASARFNVKLADHHIRIPTLLAQRIAEIVEVSLEAAFPKNSRTAPPAPTANTPGTPRDHTRDHRR